MKKKLIPCLYLQSEKAGTGFGQRNLLGDGDVEKLDLDILARICFVLKCNVEDVIEYTE